MIFIFWLKDMVSRIGLIFCSSQIMSLESKEFEVGFSVFKLPMFITHLLELNKF